MEMVNVLVSTLVLRWGGMRMRLGWSLTGPSSSELNSYPSATLYQHPPTRDRHRATRQVILHFCYTVRCSRRLVVQGSPELSPPHPGRGGSQVFVVSNVLISIGIWLLGFCETEQMWSHESILLFPFPFSSLFPYLGCPHEICWYVPPLPSRYCSICRMS